MHPIAPAPKPHQQQEAALSVKMNKDHFEL